MRGLSARSNLIGPSASPPAGETTLGRTEVAAGLRCPNSVLGGFPVPWERPEAEERPAVSCLDRRQASSLPKPPSATSTAIRCSPCRSAIRRAARPSTRRCWTSFRSPPASTANGSSASRRRCPTGARSTPNGSACSTTSSSHNVGGMDFRPADVFKAWNSAFAGDPCKHNFLRHAPGMLYLYDPPDGEAKPPYRYMPDATQPTWLVTNQMGWRGAPIEVPRGPKTIRIVFVGSSTTVGPPHLPFSYPELVGYWLNRWAESKKLGRALRGAERGAREHRVDGQCRHREERGGAAQARPCRLLRGRQPVRAALDRRQGVRRSRPRPRRRRPPPCRVGFRRPRATQPSRRASAPPSA